MQRLPLHVASFLGLGLMLAAGCSGRDGLGEPDAGRSGAAGKTGGGGDTGTGTGTGTGVAGTTGTGTGTGTGGAGTTGTGTGVGGTTGTGTGTAGATGAGGTGGTTCGPVCEIFCQYGNVSDANGCPTCKCNPPPGCAPAECGPPPPAVPLPYCPKVVPPACGRDPMTGKCAWTSFTCACPALGCLPKCEFGVKVDPNGCQTCECNPAPTECTKAECGPTPLLPSQMCSDGTVAGPVCVRNATGTCGWTITKCPPPVCPAIACLRACPYGSRVDANGCQTCDCLEPASCGTHTDYKTCTADMRCTWLQPGCSAPALATPGCFARTDVGCQSDAACSGGRACLKRVVNPCYNPTGGVTCDACGATQTVCL